MRSLEEWGGATEAPGRGGKRREQQGTAGSRGWGRSRHRLGKVPGVNGKGGRAIWGRSNLRVETFPGQWASEDTVAAF